MDVVNNEQNLFPDELKPLNDWIYSFKASITDDNALGQDVIRVMNDASTIFSTSSLRSKSKFISSIRGMWDNTFLSYANNQKDQTLSNVQENNILSRICFEINLVLGFMKSFDDDFPEIRKASGSSKRANDSDQNSTDGFQQPHKVSKVTKIGGDSPVKISNSFEALANSEDITDRNPGDSDTTAPKEPRIEPIYVKTTDNWREIAAKVDELANCKVFKSVQGDCIKFFPKSVETYRIIQNYFADQKIEFYGMKLKSERPRKVLIKGLPINFDVSEIKEELANLGYNVHRVAQLKDFKTKKPMPLFLVDVFRNETFRNIFDIREFCGFFVHVVVYKFKGAKQCYNCQRFNHSSDMCKLKPVCLKCSGEHNISDCPVKDREGIKCANCSGNHTANFGGCPMNPKNLPSNRVQTFRTANTFVNKHVKQNISFSDSLKGKNEANSIPNSAIQENNKTSETLNSYTPSRNSAQVPKSDKQIGSQEKSEIVNTVHTANAITDIDNNFLLNFVLNNFTNIDTIIEKLNNLYNVLIKFQKLYCDKKMSELLKAIGTDGQKALASSSKTK